MKKVFKFDKIHVKKDDMTVDIDFARFETQYSKAQYAMDSMIMTGMIPYMPKVTGTFINVTKAMSAAIAGGGWVYAAAPPYGRFLYEGKTMVSPRTGSTYAAAGEKKVLVSQYQGKTNAREDLIYHSGQNYRSGANREVVPHWFEKAKEVHGKNWIKVAKKIAGGG